MGYTPCLPKGTLPDTPMIPTFIKEKRKLEEVMGMPHDTLDSLSKEIQILSELHEKLVETIGRIRRRQEIQDEILKQLSDEVVKLIRRGDV